MADKLDGAAIVANSLPATAIVAGSITTTQLAPSVANVVTVGSNPKIAFLTYPDDDTAANTGGGQTVVISGSGFKSNVSVYINGNAVPSVTYTNANSISITTPALAAATYPLYVINTDDGGTAILIPGIQYSGTPSWVTTSPLDGQQALSAWSISLSATSDSSVTYTLQAGSSLPSGITLAANGLISGTMSSLPENDTTYNFTVVATDAELQDASKAFSVAVTVAVDTQFQYTTLLLQADGTNNGNNHAFLDSSNNTYTVTRSGNVSQGSYSPFSPYDWGILFDNASLVNTQTTSGKYLTVANTAAFNIGTSDFTLEGWIFPTSMPLSDAWSSNWWQHASLFGRGTPNQGDGYNLILGATKLIFQNNDGQVASGIHGITVNQWYHVAASRVSGTFHLFVNGIMVASTSSSFTGGGGSNFYIGCETGQGAFFSGTMSNVRLVVGIGLYSSNFTPPTSSLTAISGTALLVAKSNRYLDISSNAYAVSPVNTPSIQLFSPFVPTTAYVPATHVGSAYFDGSGDILSVPAAAGTFGANNFTIETWVWFTTNSAGYQPIICGAGGADARGWVITTETNNSLYFYSSNGSTWAYNITTSVTPTINCWTHFAVVRNGSTITFYINGVASGTVSVGTNAIDTPSNATYVGYYPYYPGGARSFTGYFSGTRIVSGTAVYTSAFTPPTTPLTNIANTSVLFNYSNAQIYDAVGKNILETVGDAKVNTAIKKFGAGSMVFDGTGDWLIGPSNPSASFESGDFTVEAWINPSAITGTDRCIWETRSSGSDAGMVFFIDTNAKLSTYTSGAIRTVTSQSVVANTWQHIALCRASGVMTTYINGVASNTASYSSAITCPGAVRIGVRQDNAQPYTGYIDDLRITKGLARYKYNFTPPTRAFANKGGTQTLSADEYFDYTTLLLPGNGTNNQNNHTFLDSSNNNFTITRNGNATQGTFSPFSQTGWSNYFDGTGDYLTTNATQAIPATGDFTIEAWVYPTASGPGRTIVSQGTSGSSGRLQLNVHTDNTLQFGITSSLVYSTGKVAPNFWNHIAVTRTGSSVTFYINGANAGTATLSGTVQNTALWIGAEWSGDPYRWLGYISNVRISNVIRTITSAPTAAFTSDANTVLLACQSNRFIDNSSNAYTITRAGDVSVQAFSPFNPTASYVAANVGGSGYFDGSGDYLETTSSQIIPSGNFTIEAWAYITSSNSTQTIVAQGTGVGDGARTWMGIENSSGAKWAVQVGGTQAISSVTPVLNAWHYLAMVYNGSTIKMYLNGTEIASASSTTNASNTTLKIGTNWGGYITTGFLSNIRISNTARTISAVPSSLLAADANTVFLANFTNAGITDVTAKNVLETVGDAKISTVQSKFGGSSMVFDGNGDVLIGPASNYTNYINGTADWTYEFWVYYNALPTGGTYGASIYAQDDGAGIVSPFNIVQQGNTWKLWASTNGSSWNIFDNATLATTSLATSTWYHIAFVRYGTLRMFVNGIQVAHNTDIGAATSIHTNTSRKLWLFGTWQNNPSNAGGINGYIDDVRLTKGIARYTQNFALPTTAFLTK